MPFTITVTVTNVRAVPASGVFHPVPYLTAGEAALAVWAGPVKPKSVWSRDSPEIPTARQHQTFETPISWGEGRGQPSLTSSPPSPGLARIPKRGHNSPSPVVGSLLAVFALHHVLVAPRPPRPAGLAVRPQDVLGEGPACHWPYRPKVSVRRRRIGSFNGCANARVQGPAANNAIAPCLLVRPASNMRSASSPTTRLARSTP